MMRKALNWITMNTMRKYLTIDTSNKEHKVKHDKYDANDDYSAM